MNLSGIFSLVVISMWLMSCSSKDNGKPQPRPTTPVNNSAGKGGSPGPSNSDPSIFSAGAPSSTQGGTLSAPRSGIEDPEMGQLGATTFDFEGLPIPWQEGSTHESLNDVQFQLDEPMTFSKRATEDPVAVIISNGKSTSAYKADKDADVFNFIIKTLGTIAPESVEGTDLKPNFAPYCTNNHTLGVFAETLMPLPAKTTMETIAKGSIFVDRDTQVKVVNTLVNFYKEGNRYGKAIQYYDCYAPYDGGTAREQLERILKGAFHASVIGNATRVPNFDN